MVTLRNQASIFLLCWIHNWDLLTYKSYWWNMSVAAAVKHALWSNKRFVSLCYVRISSRHQGNVLPINPSTYLSCVMSNICRQEPNVMALNEQWVSGAACSQFTDPTLIPCFPNLQLSSPWRCGPRAEKAPWSRPLWVWTLAFGGQN